MEVAVAERFHQNERSIDRAQNTAEQALAVNSAHEILCAERYKNIDKHLTGLPDRFENIFKQLGALQKLVYIGVGIWVGIPVIAGAIFGVIELIKAFSHG